MTETQTLEVTLAQPVHAGTLPSKSSISDTHTFIPGSVVRGALATAWLNQTGGKPSDPLFQQLFEGGVRFGPLYADGVRPRALSRLFHKYKVKTACNDGWDLFFAGEKYREGLGVGLFCATCDSPLEAGKGEVDAETKVRRHVHLANDTAVDSELFGRKSLARTKLVGDISGDSELLRELSRLGGASFGGRGTTQGWGALSFVELSDVTTVERTSTGTNTKFGVRLTSPAIFVDDEGFPSKAPNPHQLAGLLGVHTDQVEIQAAWSRWTQVGGWHLASQLPKPVELAVVAGSTFTVFIKGADIENSFLDSTLRLNGLGLRRHEGFGHIEGVRAPDLSEASTSAAPPEWASGAEMFVRTFNPLQKASLHKVLHGLSSADPATAAKMRNLLIERILPTTSPSSAIYASSIRKMANDPNLPKFADLIERWFN